MRTCAAQRLLLPVWPRPPSISPASQPRVPPTLRASPSQTLVVLIVVSMIIREKAIRTVGSCVAYESCTQRYLRTWAVLTVDCWFWRFRFIFVCLFMFSILCFFCFSLDYFVLVLFAFVVVDLISAILRQEMGWEERLRNDLFCVQWAVKP